MIVTHRYLNELPGSDLVEAARITRSKLSEVLKTKEEFEKNLHFKFIEDLIHAEHSPIRSVVIRFYLEDVPYWVQNHLVRHHEGINWFVGSQRSNPDRNSARQDEPVDIIMDANIQALINLGRARLCSKAAKETRELVQLIKDSLFEDDYWLSQVIYNHMKPKCEWYGKCFEAKPCGRIDKIEVPTSSCFCGNDH